MFDYPTPIWKRVRNLCIVGLVLIILRFLFFIFSRYLHLRLSFFIIFSPFLLIAGVAIIGGTFPGGYGKKIGVIGGFFFGLIIINILNLLEVLLLRLPINAVKLFEVGLFTILFFGIPSSIVGYLVGSWADKKKEELEMQREKSKKIFVSSQQSQKIQRELQHSSQSEGHLYQHSKGSSSDIEKDIEKSERPIDREKRSQEKIKCPSCGKAISTNSNFCTYCGNEV